MQQYVRGTRDARAGSPQNRPSSSSTQRRVIGANAKVSMKPHVARGQEPPTHGESIAQHQTLLPPQQPVQVRSGTGQRDAWETDTGSIDSTANQSVVRVKDESKVNQQQTQLEYHEAGDDKDAFGEDEREEDEGSEWPEEVDKYLADNNLTEASYEDQRVFLIKTQPQLFTTIDGDSYPTTTDGNPTVWDEEQTPRYEDLGSPTPSPRSHFREDLDPSSLYQHSLQRNMASGHGNAAMPEDRKLWQQGAQLRGKQRTDDALHAREQLAQPHTATYPSTSWLPKNSQAIVQQHNATVPATQARPEVIVQGVRSSLPQASSGPPPGPKHHQNPIPNIIQPTLASKHTSTIRAKVVPTPQPHNEPAPSKEPVLLPNCDYDEKVLFNMGYDQLKDESFDTNPRANTPFLSEELRSKPLHERLEFARTLDPANQFDFFDTLPTNEWEDAGDWFLDQFSAIIKKTREARQKKRTAAQRIENEIEERHQHVAKKQRLVASAMSKMKAQGEGLVPRSPRASKSPRPRRG